jgi:hypothetical protein
LAYPSIGIEKFTGMKRGTNWKRQHTRIRRPLGGITWRQEKREERQGMKPPAMAMANEGDQDLNPGS